MILCSVVCRYSGLPPLGLNDVHFCLGEPRWLMAVYVLDVQLPTDS